MRLYRVDGETIRNGTYTGYLVANNKDDAERRFYQIHQDISFYTSFVSEIDNIDGYKVIIKKGKKIQLE